MYRSEAYTHSKQYAKDWSCVIVSRHDIDGYILVTILRKLRTENA